MSHADIGTHVANVMAHAGRFCATNQPKPTEASDDNRTSKNNHWSTKSKN